MREQRVTEETHYKMNRIQNCNLMFHHRRRKEWISSVAFLLDIQEENNKSTSLTMFWAWVLNAVRISHRQVGCASLRMWHEDEKEEMAKMERQMERQSHHHYDNRDLGVFWQ